MMSRNVNTARPRQKGISTWRITYRSMILMERLHYDARRAAVAHAPAVLRGPRDRRTHPAVGPPACPEGLLGHGGAAARVPGREGHVQPGALDARAARLVRARGGA